MSNRTIVIAVEAIDDAANTSGAQTLSVSVIGVLDHCEGSIPPTRRAATSAMR